MQTIHWGIIGCGDVTELKSGPAFNKVDHSRLVAVMRRDAVKAEDYARRHHVPRWYDDAAKLIHDPEVNAIYVATPPSSHEEYVIAAVRAGKPVYVEKPMANDYAAACRMNDVAAAKGIKLVVAHYRREQPRFRKVKQLIDAKAIGEILLVRLELSKPPMTAAEMADPKIGWRVVPAIAGGGLFHDLGTHQLDLMSYFFGPAQKVTGFAANQGHNYAADDLVVGNILYENGVAFSGTWCFNAAPAATRDHCEIIGTKGKISFAVFSTDTVTVMTDDSTVTHSFDPLLHVQQPMIDATVRYFLDEGPNPSSGPEGAEIMRLIEAFVRKTSAAFFLMFLFLVHAAAQPTDAQYPIIPYPAQLTPAPGHFIITPATTIVLPGDGLFRNEADMLNILFTHSFGKPLGKGTPASKKAIRFTYDSSIEAEEGYRLIITPLGMTLAAHTAAGMFMAVQTIRQLLPAQTERPLTRQWRTIALPAVNIEDAPAWSWRGMHLDVSRHFFSIGYLKKFIDVMALYKMNRLHLHLTDDQGWRIEIKKYPLLTEQGAWRTFDKNDSACIRKSHDNPDFTIDPQHIRHKDGKTQYGGFYTQEQMKGLVAYAAARHIDIIPEIDMPGHMMAAITAYPYLSCNGENTFGELFSKPICPCSETTFEFAENVFTEIMAIFPSPYIHIGGDEVDRSDWAKSPACKALMQREGISDLPALQSYFINRMEKFFRSRGRRLIGWDEVIEGGINPTAVVMYWRSWVPDAPVKAARNGNSVIMAPGDPLYFDNPPDQNSLSRIYHFNPIPARLVGQERKAIIGAQAELWSENIPSERRADYMFMPRMTALSELLWTNKREDYPSYLDRLQQQYRRLDELQVHYRLPDLPGIITENVFVDADTLTVKKPLADMRIFYTTDGSLPRMSATELKMRLIIKKSATIKLAAFMSNGLCGDIYTLHFKQQDYAEAIRADSGTRPGLVCHYYKAFFKQTSLISGAKSDSTFLSNTITVPATVTAPSFAINYKGYIDIPADGIYSFFLTCDDGGVLKIAGRVVVDNDGLHSAIEKNGQIPLRKGLQPFDLDFIEGGGGYTLKLQYSINGSEPVDIPSEWFKNTRR